ncbi:hypothetical protein H8R18_00600 [Nanchangia anserum]|uniref:Uncharacterized protein n=1 Tax=Nanchangia anserum TaxID=2692125 RepID=A0A8I0GCH7_9ACTO|nr:hypothetical protein [Nanchangia anserum]MBD3689746.1 hypothetical protein [Nanchangia anserum]QOX81915.1 hypothetical protein H8R18_00600 [Nanchangia anserum]
MAAFGIIGKGVAGLARPLPLPWGRLWWLVVAALVMVVIVKKIPDRTLTPPATHSEAGDWYHQVYVLLRHRMWWPRVEAHAAVQRARDAATADGVDPEDMFGAPQDYARVLTETDGGAAVQREARFRVGITTFLAAAMVVTVVISVRDGSWFTAVCAAGLGLLMAGAAWKAFGNVR